MKCIRFALPAFMFVGVTFILSGLGLPLWAAIITNSVVAFIAYAQYEAHRQDEGAEE